MHRGRRLIGLAGAIAAIATSLTVSTVAAAGSARRRPRLRQQQQQRPEHHRRVRSPRRWLPDPARWVAVQRRRRRNRRPFGSAGGLQRSANGRYLLATDPASNQISVLRIKPERRAAARRSRWVAWHAALTASPSTAASSMSPTAARAAATTPGSASTRAATYADRRIDLRPARQRPPRTRPDQPGWPSPRRHTGRPERRAFVPRWVPDRHDGRLTAAPGSPFAAQRIGPFGSAFSPVDDDRLFVSNAHDGAGTGSVSVYDVAADGGADRDQRVAIRGRPDGALLGRDEPRRIRAVRDQHGVSPISRYAVAADGTLTLAGSTAMSSPSGLRPFDASVSPNGRFLYVVDAGAAKVSAFAVDGTASPS